MDKNELWLQWAIELQSLAQAGLTYGKDVYDKERYERIREISAEILSHMSDIPTEKVKTLFCNETGYQTPKIDTRAAKIKFFLSTKITAPGHFPADGVMLMFPSRKILSKK